LKKFNNAFGDKSCHTGKIKVHNQNTEHHKRFTLIHKGWWYNILRELWAIQRTESKQDSKRCPKDKKWKVSIGLKDKEERKKMKREFIKN
jgi:hypothetical protein